MASHHLSESAVLVSHALGVNLQARSGEGDAVLDYDPDLKRLTISLYRRGLCVSGMSRGIMYAHGGLGDCSWERIVPDIDDALEHMPRGSCLLATPIEGRWYVYCWKDD